MYLQILSTIPDKSIQVERYFIRHAHIGYIGVKEDKSGVSLVGISLHNSSFLLKLSIHGENLRYFPMPLYGMNGSPGINGCNQVVNQG